MEVLSRVVEGGQILEPGSLMSSEPWWYRCITLSDDPSRFGKSANSAYLSNLQKVDQSFTAKDLGRDVIDICIGNR